MLNLLYCLDQNYNLQTITSIMSFLKNTDESINIYIIHENPESFEEYLQKIKKEETLKRKIINRLKRKGHYWQAIFLDTCILKNLQEYFHSNHNIF